jgi:uncharacterized protein YdaU (DUF1376 family)
MDWFPWYPIHYEADTGHLTLEQDAIYRRLIDWYMVHERPLTNDERALASAARVDLDVWQRNAEAVLAFFVPRDNMVLSPRCEVELNEQSTRRQRETEKKRRQREAKSLIRNNHVPGAVPAMSPLTGQDNTDGGDGTRARDLADRLMALFPQNAVIVNYSRIDTWLRQGFDFDLDVLPAVSGVVARQPPNWTPHSFDYFDKPIARAHAARTKPIPEVPDEPARNPQHPDRRSNQDRFTAQLLRAAAAGKN